MFVPSRPDAATDIGQFMPPDPRWHWTGRFCNYRSFCAST